MLVLVVVKFDVLIIIVFNVNVIEFFLIVFIIDFFFYKGLLNKICELKIIFKIIKLFFEIDDKVNYDLLNIE